MTESAAVQRRPKGAEDHPAVVHVGYVRTATTTHQRQIFSKHKDIAYLGKPYPAPVIKDIVYQFTSTDSAIFDLPAARSALEKVLAEVVIPNKRVPVLSDEAILGPYSVDTPVLCRRLIALFGDPKVVITIRRQDELLISWLFHVIKKRYARPLAWMLKSLGRESHLSTGLLHYLDYASICRVFADELGRENLLVIPYELFTSDQVKYTEMLSAFMGVDQEETRRLLEPSSVSNQRQHSAGVAYFDFRSRYLPTAVQTPSIDSLLIKIFGVTRFNAHHDGDIAAEARALCTRQYAQSNRLLAEAFGLDLKSYGYPGFGGAEHKRVET